MNQKDKELYSYVVSSLDILNKQLVVQEKNVVKLFSYLYNYNTQLENKIQDLETIILDYKNLIKKNEENYNKKYNDLDKNINDVQQSIKEIDKNFNKKINDESKKLKKYIDNNPNNSIVINEIKHTLHIKEFFVNIFNKIKEEYYSIKDKIYKLIYRKRILEEQEEEQRKEIEEKEKKRKEDLDKIKNILNNIK